MATLRFDVGSNTFSKTISAGDVTRLSAAVKTQFGLPSNATDAVCAATLAEWLWSQVKGLVKETERNAAMKTAGDGVSDISLT